MFPIVTRYHFQVSSRSDMVLLPNNLFPRVPVGNGIWRQGCQVIVGYILPLKLVSRQKRLVHLEKESAWEGGLYDIITHWIPPLPKPNPLQAQPPNFQVVPNPELANLSGGWRSPISRKHMVNPNYLLTSRLVMNDWGLSFIAIESVLFCMLHTVCCRGV